MKKCDFMVGALIAIVVAVVLTAPITIWVTKSCFEANAYNRVTGAKVTTWDAMWIELRVQGETK